MWTGDSSYGLELHAEWLRLRSLVGESESCMCASLSNCALTVLEQHWHGI